jgi:hypothetical protein
MGCHNKETIILLLVETNLTLSKAIQNVIINITRTISFKRFGWFMMINATFNTISVISRRSVILVEETGVPGENHRPVAIH